MKSIKAKIVVYLLPLILVAVIGIVIMFYRFSYDEIFKSTYAELDTTAYRYSWQIQSWFAEKAGAMKAGARAIESTDGQDQSILKYLQNASEEFVADGAAELYMGTEEGGMLFLSGSLPDGYDPRQRPWYIDAAKTDDVIFTEPYPDESGRYGVAVSTSVKVKNSDGSTKGVLATDLSLAIVSEQTKDIKLGEAGYLFAVDNKSGMIVLHPDSEVLGKNILEAFPEFEKVMENIAHSSAKNNSYTGKDGEKYWVSNARVDLTDWTLFAIKSEKEALASVNTLMYVIIAIVIGVGIILTLVLLYSVSQITKPIKGLLKEINQIGSGDFSNPIPAVLLKQKDEIGAFAKTVEKMRVDIRHIIENIVDTSTQNNQNISTVFEKIDYLDAYIKEVSAITQKLSVNVKEMASSTEKTTTNANAIEATVDGMARKSHENMDNMETMKNRALQVMTHSRQSWEAANVTREGVESKLEEAIKQSEVIGRIGVLSNTIMQITEETSLLALNAAIEAARVGEQGKGFAVVASEIKQLSENSQEAVSQIKEVMVLLENAVTELVKNSQMMLEFFRTQIIMDYEEMVKTGEQYHGDASDVSSVFKDFSVSTESLNKAIKLITNVLGEIALTSRESSDENRKVTEKSVLLLNNSKDIMEIVKDTKEKSMLLMKIVENFKI